MNTGKTNLSRVFAVCSPVPGCGKDTIKNYLVESYPGVTMGWAFADTLKSYARMFGWNGIKDKNGREFLIALGLAVRLYNKYFWVNSVVSEINVSLFPYHVISDMRFFNEYEVLKKTYGDRLVVVGVERPSIGNEWANDPSQVEYAIIPKDVVIQNDVPLYKFIDEIDKALGGYYE